jgi:serine phosphatase RsbU (regulator of sigma subunit)
MVQEAVPDRRARSTRARWFVVGVVVLFGLGLTAPLAWAVRSIDRSTEHRLLEVQTKQAAAVITAAVVGIVGPLHSALEVASATEGDAPSFGRFMSDQVGAGKIFVAASLWRLDGRSPVEVAATGVAPGLPAPAARTQAFVRKAQGSPTFVVTSVAGPQLRVAYAVSAPRARYAVYAERAIPANRRVPVESDSAFVDLHFATYLGPKITGAALQTTDVAPNELPLTGTTAQASIPFGDTTLTLVASPATHLSGNAGRTLPWVLLGGGILLTVVASILGWQIMTRRGAADAHTRTITRLYERIDAAYNEQRSIAESLQVALLPRSNPEIPGLEIASLYRAGAVGAQIGGDWYSIISVDDDTFAFVVGDVSGRGIDAAALMGRVRFTLRAYLLEGHPPEAALAMCARDVDLGHDRHMATALVGVGDLTTRWITIANAGHLPPLVLVDGQAQYATTLTGRPLGVAPPNYRSSVFEMPEGSTLIAFTDGLIERRGEDIDLSLDRLAAAATETTGPLPTVLDQLLATFAPDGAEDDIAVLAFRWVEGRGATIDGPTRQVNGVA